MRRLRALLALGLALSLAACQSAGAGGSDGGAAARPPDARIQQILDRGVLRVAVSGDRPPLNAKNARGEIVGFEADIVRSLADAMSLRLEFVTLPFADLIPAVLRGDADLAISGLTMTPERNARVAFAGPYYISGMSVLSKDPAITQITTPAQLDVAKRRYAAVESSTSAKFIEGLLPKAQLVTVPDYASGVRMVTSGEVDALFGDHLACATEVWRHPEAHLQSLDTPLTIEPLGIAVPPDAPLLLNLVENHLDTLDHTGLLIRFKAKWLADGGWLGELE